MIPITISPMQINIYDLKIPKFINVGNCNDINTKQF